MELKFRGYFPHRVFICALFLLGNTIIAFPNGIGVYGFLIASALGLLFAGSVSFIIKKASSKPIQKALKNAVSVMLILLFLVFFAVSTKDYVIFTESTKMPNTSTALIAMVFSVLSIYCGFQRKATLYRLSVICFIIAVFVIFVLLLLSLPQGVPQRLKGELGTNGIFKLMLSAFLGSFAVYFFIRGERGVAAALSGTALGSFLLLVCFFIAVSVLGSAINKVPYPLAAVSGTTSFGGGFSRFEGFIYLLFLLTCFVKCSVLASLIGNLSGSLHKKLKKVMAVAMPVFAVIFSLIYQ